MAVKRTTLRVNQRVDTEIKGDARNLGPWNHYLTTDLTDSEVCPTSEPPIVWITQSLFLKMFKLGFLLNLSKLSQLIKNKATFFGALPAMSLKYGISCEEIAEWYVMRTSKFLKTSLWSWLGCCELYTVFSTNQDYNTSANGREIMEC